MRPHEGVRASDIDYPQRHLLGLCKAFCIGSGIAELSRVRFYETMTTTSGSAYWESPKS